MGKKQERVLSFSRHFQPKAGSRANDGQLCNGLGGFGEDGGVDLKRKNLEEVYEYIRYTVKPLIKDTPKEDKPPNKGQAKSTLVYTNYRNLNHL